MGELIEDPDLRDRRFVFEDRQDAGRRLAAFLGHYRGSTNALLFAVPSGGVPVAAEAARILSLPLDLLIVRKLQIPFNPEAGFGAMALNGDVLLNDELVESVRLGKEDIAAAVNTTKKVLDQRNRLFRGDRPLPPCGGKKVIITDDGLASGYTMRVAARWVRSMAPERIVVAVPTGSERTVDIIRREVDEIVCLNVRSGYRFAVAEAYRRWHDLSDDEVLRIIVSVFG
ncbi:MAG: phosphoribosyltransferase [Nitrospirae bacterium]|nr:phosphoribosyltransferase [Nitrospirota bacterium]